MRTRHEILRDLLQAIFEIEEHGAGDANDDGSPGALWVAGNISRALIDEATAAVAGTLAEPAPVEPIYECQNCACRWIESELQPIEDIFERVAPGEVMPAGECPSCGALCHQIQLDVEVTK